MTTPKKLIAAAAFSVALAAGGAAGALLGTPLTSSAQESTTSTTVPASRAADHAHRGDRHGPKLTVAAKALGMSEADLRTALEGGKTIAQVAKDQGVDIDTVIDALVADATANIRERITAMVNGQMPEGGGRHEGRGGHDGRGGRAFAPDPQVVADALGTTTDEVRAALQSGQTLAQIAAANNVDVQDVIDAMVASATAKIDAKVASGDLDADRATEMKSHLVERITAVVNGERPARPDRPDDTETP